MNDHHDEQRVHAIFAALRRSAETVRVDLLERVNAVALDRGSLAPDGERVVSGTLAELTAMAGWFAMSIQQLLFNRGQDDDS